MKFSSWSDSLIRQGTPDVPFRHGTGSGNQPNIAKGIAHRRQRGVHRRPSGRDWDTIIFLSIAWVVSLSFLAAAMLFGFVYGWQYELPGRSFGLNALATLVMSIVFVSISIMLSILMPNRKARRPHSGNGASSSKH